jgi:hypothetical protein
VRKSRLIKNEQHAINTLHRSHIASPSPSSSLLPLESQSPSISRPRTLYYYRQNRQHQQQQQQQQHHNAIHNLETPRSPLLPPHPSYPKIPPPHSLALHRPNPHPHRRPRPRLALRNPRPPLSLTLHALDNTRCERVVGRVACVGGTIELQDYCGREKERRCIVGTGVGASHCARSVSYFWVGVCGGSCWEGVTGMII